MVDRSPYQYLDLIFDCLHGPVDFKISKPWPRLSPSRMSYCLWISSDLLTMCPIRTWGTDRTQRCTSIMRKIETWKIVFDLSFYVNYFILSLIRQRNILPSVQITDWKRTVPRVLTLRGDETGISPVGTPFPSSTTSHSKDSNSHSPRWSALVNSTLSGSRLVNLGKRYPWGDEISHDDANYDGTGGKDKW